MSGNPTRVLCPRCYQSFTPAPDCGDLCSTCTAQEAHRAGGGDFSPPPGPSEHAREAGSSVAIPAPATIGGWIVDLIPRQVREARAWCEGRVPWVRLPIWIYLAYTFGKHLGSDEPYRSLFDGINLGIHELGHAIFRPLGTYLMAAGGTITQLAAPIAAMFIFRRQKDFFGVSVALCWVATNLWGISVYMADARALQLPLVAPGMGLMPGGDASGGGGIIHDWNYLLGGPGLLKYDTLLAGGVAVAAVVSMLVGLAFGAWLLWRMFRSDVGPQLRFDEDF